MLQTVHGKPSHRRTPNEAQGVSKLHEGQEGGLRRDCGRPGGHIDGAVDGHECHQCEHYAAVLTSSLPWLDAV